ncbi:hypothetical protein Patl1_23471 [Pistacia atlantica]|uniref:Uncharacterized protein n=1 Tax=Pistacia atlantica TaxID=434234 RepID=A0ACC0ZZF0_9ROSI|nr:hypothetical protein Patl1_23471 [Pistacia atlantica]
MATMRAREAEWDSLEELFERGETINDRDEEMVDLSYVINITEEEVRREIEDLKECYEEEATAPFPDDDYLAWMFFVDGCALLHYIDFAVTDKEDTMIKEFKERVHDLQFFRNIEELKAAGIRLRPSGTFCLRDITFNLGTLRLLSIQVADSTASRLLNLIAYEMCPDFVNDFGVSSYVAFLDILIDQAQDVKELRDKQILHNFLGSDEDVAKLFNEIGTDLVSNPNIYRDVKSKIQRRYDNKFMTSMAQFIHEYFRSPWSAIAFVAAIIALASTVAQTVYTILGYYK